MTNTRVYSVRIALSALLIVCFFGSEALAQKKNTKQRVEDLETAVERIDGKVNDVVGSEKPEKIRERQEELQEKLDELTQELEDLKSDSEDVASANEERDARMDALAEETTDTWKEVETNKEGIEDLKDSKTVGYDRGFFLASQDGKHRLSVTGFMKPYYRAVFQTLWATNSNGTLDYDDFGQLQGGDNEVTDSGFGLAATRLTFDAQVFSYIKFKLEIDYGNNSGKVQYPGNAALPDDIGYGKVKINEYNLRALGAYGEFAPMPQLKLRAGQFKVPFDKEGLNPSGKRTFTSNSLMTRSYSRWGEFGIPSDAINYGHAYETQRGSSFGYDRGFQVAGCFTDGLFQYGVGVFNGNGPNVGNNNRDIMVAVRLSSDFLAAINGKMSSGMSDVETSEKPHLELGAAFAYDLPLHHDLIDAQYTYNSQDVNVTADLHFKWMGVSLLSSFFFRNSDHGAVLMDVNGQERPIKSAGVMAQLAYFNDFTNLEPAFRYSMYDADVDRMEDHIHEITAAVNYYPFAHNLKLSLEYRGLFAANKGHSYMYPWGNESINETWWFEDAHELSIMAQVGF